LFIDGTGIGQYTFAPASQQSFSVSAGSHIARGTELGGSQQAFPPEVVAVPAGGAGTYLMACIPDPPPPEPGPPFPSLRAASIR
jgi:hypothetical protein